MYLVNFAQQSNASDWIDTIDLRSADDATLIDLTGWSVDLQVWPQTYRGAGTNASWLGWNAVTPVLEASTANGKITIPQAGVIQWTFRASELNDLPAGVYEVGIILTKSPDTVQILLGQLPIVNGANG